MMSSIICQNFVQNAWKKELCSNCFKSKDEHLLKSDDAVVRHVAEENRGNQRVGIMKTKASPTRSKKSKVNFKSNLTQVIGYGGEDWSEEEEDVVAYEEEMTETDAVSREELELLHLTKTNTDFNTNLSTQKLQLGRAQIDAEGRRQTLLVQVTPFGGSGQEVSKARSSKCKDNANKDEVDANPMPSKRITSFLVKEIGKDENEKFKEVTEEVNAVNATKHAQDREKSLLDEINETLEKSKNPIVKKIVQQEIILSKPVVAEAVRTQVKLARTPMVNGSKLTFQSSKSVNLSADVPTEPTTKDYEDATNTSSSVDDSSSHCGSEDSNSTDSSLETSVPKVPKLVETNFEEFSMSASLPALPDTPPPKVATPPATRLEEKVKPKVPTKPSTILIRKSASASPIMGTIPSPALILSTFNGDKMAPKDDSHVALVKRDSNGSDISKKRKAPNPPPNEEVSLGPASVPMYTRKPIPMAHNDCPVVREKEKRERASSCTPKTLSNPEPAPRRILSASTDSLNQTGEEKKKRAKFSLKKLLRMGGHSSNSNNNSLSSSKTDVTEEKPMPKPRLVIVHPLELQAKAEEQEYVNSGFFQSQVRLQNRPPPPPRNYEPYADHKLPPKTSQAKQLQAAARTRETDGRKPAETVYANIGEVRNAITPNKPQRTASMREIKDTTSPAADHVYDYIGNRSSSPECDSKKSNASAMPVAAHPHTAVRSMSMTYCGSETESEIYSPYSYCGSESEIADDEPECCYGNGLGSTGRTHKLRSKKGRSIVHTNLEDNYGAVVIANHEALAQVLENIQQTVHVPLPLRALKTTDNLRWSDFQLRIVSRSSSPAPSSTTTGTTCTTATSSAVIIGNCSFHQAMWNLQNVTLMIAVVPQSPSVSLGTFTLQPITEFSDLVPASCVKKSHLPVQANVSVLPHLIVHSIASLSDHLRTSKPEDTHKSSALVLLQLINGLKALQAQGVEELPLSLSSFVLGKEVERQEAHSRLFILQPNDDPTHHAPARSTLCAIVSRALQMLPVDGTLQRLMQSLLATERAVSLSQAKAVLEFSLWGPSDIALGATPQERELVLQRWLDLQRATVLHGLVCAKVQLTVYEECHLLFLVRSNAKMMCDASLLLESVPRC